MAQDKEAPTPDLACFEKMGPAEKWEELGKLGPGFDKSRSPFQDFRNLFTFRDDHVHAKVRDFVGRSRRGYHGRLPDPVAGLLDLSHALYAAETYWDMVQEVHRLIGFDQAKFHRDYNLAPWFDEPSRLSWHEIARQCKQ